MKNLPLHLAAFILAAGAVTAGAKANQAVVNPDGPSETASPAADSSSASGAEAPRPRRRPRHTKPQIPGESAPASDMSRTVTMPADSPAPKPASEPMLAPISTPPGGETPAPRKRRRRKAVPAGEQTQIGEAPAPSAEGTPPLPGTEPEAAAASRETPEAARETPSLESAEGRMVKAYVENRVVELKRSAAEQDAYGRKLGDDWAAFWAKMNRERRQFELSIARQRLNLFETLATLEPSSYAQTLAKYESYQSQQIFAFDKAQKQALETFFSGMHADLRQFGSDQQKQHELAIKGLKSSWETMKKGGPPPSAAPRDEPRSEKKTEVGEERKEEALPDAPEPKKKKGFFFD
ncbi:MAG: hypothetical protein WC969_01530 [Elusimicrobiota bacterium]|jgi:hypothetical protein